MTTPVPPRPRLLPQAGPAAWRAADLSPSDWMIPVGAEHVAELDAVLDALGGRAPATAAEAPMPALGAVLRDAARRLDAGRGLALLRGFPLSERAEAAALALGVHLGRAIPALRGDGPGDGPGDRPGEGAGGLVSHVVSPAGGAARWRFHADPADIVLTLLLRQPPESDPAMLVAAATVQNEMLKRDRAALELLHRPMPHLRPDGAGVVDLPVFSSASGAFIGRYARDAIEGAQRLPETPRLSAAQVAALDLLDEICAAPGLALRLDLRPGDVLLLNPLQVWKRRAEALEGDEAPPVREALRLMLVTESSRALPGGLVPVGV